MKITKDMVGKKVRKRCWHDSSYLKILYVGKERFFAEGSKGYEHEWTLDADWELVEEKKLYAPALIQPLIGVPFITRGLFISMEEAKQHWNNDVSKWPAPLPNKDGYYEL